MWLSDRGAREPTRYCGGSSLLAALRSGIELTFIVVDASIPSPSPTTSIAWPMHSFCHQLHETFGLGGLFELDARFPIIAFPPESHLIRLLVQVLIARRRHVGSQ